MGNTNSAIYKDGCKRCSRCKEYKPLGENFRPRKDKSRGKERNGWSPMCNDCTREVVRVRSLKYYHENYKNDEDFKKKRRAQQLKRNFNLTPEDVEQMRIFQDNKCDICGETFVETPHIDHDDTVDSKPVRGLLCGNCNRGIGYLYHNPQTMRNLADLLEGIGGNNG